MNRKYIRNVVVFVVSLFILDRGVAYILNRLVKGAPCGSIERNITTINQDTSSILILGTSRALHHYVPEIISKETGLTCRNGGVELGYLSMVKKILLSIVPRHRPKVIVFDLTPWDLVWVEPKFNATLYNKLKLVPNNIALDSILKAEDQTKYYFNLIFNSFKYNNEVLNIMRCQFSIFNPSSRSGYIPLEGQRVREPLAESLEERLHPGFKEDLDFVIDICKGNGIKPIFAVSPSYYHESASVVRELDSYLKDKGAVFFDFNAFFNKTDWPYFYDISHLNDQGAHQFSKHFAEKLNHLVIH